MFFKNWHQSFYRPSFSQIKIHFKFKFSQQSFQRDFRYGCQLNRFWKCPSCFTQNCLINSARINLVTLYYAEVIKYALYWVIFIKLLCFGLLDMWKHNMKHKGWLLCLTPSRLFLWSDNWFIFLQSEDQENSCLCNQTITDPGCHM